MLWILPLSALSLCALRVAAAPQVAVTIKPLQLIAAAITEGASSPVVVWGQGQDPHHVSLRPSERRLLGEADVVLWIGPMLERPLTGLIPELDAEVITVQELAGLELIAVDGQPDPHVWAHTRNARTIASALSVALAQLDPANAELYRANATRFGAQLDTLATDLANTLTPGVQGKWAVYHHALRYLEREFGLQPPLALADGENNSPGIRTAMRVRAEMQEGGVRCMLAEPGVNHDEVLTMLDLPDLRIVDADVMALQSGADSYIGYMQTLGATVSACLEP